MFYDFFSNNNNNSNIYTFPFTKVISENDTYFELSLTFGYFSIVQQWKRFKLSAKRSSQTDLNLNLDKNQIIPERHLLLSQIPFEESKQVLTRQTFLKKKGVYRIALWLVNLSIDPPPSPPNLFMIGGPSLCSCHEKHSDGPHCPLGNEVWRFDENWIYFLKKTTIPIETK